VGKETYGNKIYILVDDRHLADKLAGENATLERHLEGPDDESQAVSDLNTG
jgi:hypothetical protein